MAILASSMTWLFLQWIMYIPVCVYVLVCICVRVCVCRCTRIGMSEVNARCFPQSKLSLSLIPKLIYLPSLACEPLLSLSYQWKDYKCVLSRFLGFFFKCDCCRSNWNIQAYIVNILLTQTLPRPFAELVLKFLHILQFPCNGKYIPWYTSLAMHVSPYKQCVITSDSFSNSVLYIKSMASPHSHFLD